MAVAVRATSAVNTFGGTITVTLPTGTIAGDLFVVLGGGSYDIGSTPSGYTKIANLSGSFINGWVIYKTMVAADITAGSVAVTMAGSDAVAAFGVSLTGSNDTPTEKYSFRSSSTITADQTSSTYARTTDSVQLYAGFLRSGSAAPTMNRGTSQETNTSNIFSRVNAETVGTGDSQAVTFQTLSGQPYLVALEVPPPSGTSAGGTGSLSLTGTAGGGGTGTATGSLSFSGTAVASSTPAEGSGSLTLGGTAGGEGTSTATGSLSFGGSGEALAPAEASATGGLTLTGTAVALALFQADQANRVGGRWRNGIGYATWTPALQLPPVVELAPRVSVLSFSAPTVDDTNGRVSYTAQRVEQDDYIDRVIVGSKDVTFWRGVHTPTPSFILVEPFGYGPASLTFPQVAASFERPGVGALQFLRLGASVKIQRVNRLTEEIIATDYKGLIISHDTSGSTLACQVGGEATGRAAMLQKQVPIFTWKKDLGLMAHDAIRDLGLRFDPYLGPVTGIRLQRFGGTGMLDYMQQIVAMAWTRAGNRWTVMPNEETGAYEMYRRDRTTIHATAYLDDARTVGSLVRDMSEEPNRFFMTGITPEGKRVRFGAYPGLKYTEPPPYPFASNQTFGQGTTNADTDTGDGITILINRLNIMKYIDREFTPGGYDIDVTRAIRDLQRDAGLNVTGNVNPNTWTVLYDFDTTGWSLRGSRILPAAESQKVKEWNRSPSGALLSRNPEYDPSVTPVERNIDVGTGYERSQMREWARSELQDSNDDNWVGSIEFNTLALIRGEHNLGDALTEGDIMPARDLRSGMNIWLPTFAGGILVHIASVSVTGGTVSVDVDTRARDAMEVWEVMARNRESRRSLRRAFIREHRSSTQTKDSTTPWDEIGGILGDKTTIPANTWTVFPIIAGQEGTIARLRTNTNPNAEYVLAVFGKHIWQSRLQRSIGNPLTHAGSKKWANESVRDSLDRQFIILYVAGSDEEPLGYWPKTKTGKADDDVAAAPLTGKWQDDAGFPYKCFNAPVLWVAVYADRDTSIPQGRIMWPQLEAGT